MKISYAAMLFGQRALVVKEWHMDETAPIKVRIVARKAGLIAWLMSLLKLDPTTVFELRENHVWVSEGSLAGQIRELIPLSGICNLGVGYLKPFGYIIAAIGLFIYSMITFNNEYASNWMGFLQLLLAICSIIAYFLNKSLVLYFNPISNNSTILSFKRSVIEGVNIDEEEAKKVIKTVATSIMQATKK